MSEFPIYLLLEVMLSWDMFNIVMVAENLVGRRMKLFFSFSFFFLLPTSY